MPVPPITSMIPHGPNVKPSIFAMDDTSNEEVDPGNLSSSDGDHATLVHDNTTCNTSEKEGYDRCSTSVTVHYELCPMFDTILCSGVKGST